MSYLVAVVERPMLVSWEKNHRISLGRTICTLELSLFQLQSILHTGILISFAIEGHPFIASWPSWLVHLFMPIEWIWWISNFQSQIYTSLR